MVLYLMPLMLEACGATDVGLVRPNNEDNWGEIPDKGFYVLADGMGGHRAGEVASKEAVNGMVHIFQSIIDEPIQEERSIEEWQLVLSFAMEQVNDNVYELGRSSDLLKGMGTTLCVFYRVNNHMVYGHIGDSRIYRWRKGVLSQLSKDHSLLSNLIDKGEVKEEDAKDFLYKNILTRAVGTESSVIPSVSSDEMEANDLYFTCSDGLSDLVSNKELEAFINKKMEESPSKERLSKKSSLVNSLVHSFVDLAKEQGGSDNITVVMVQVKEADTK